MANRRCFQTLTQRFYKATIYANPPSLPSLQSLRTLALISLPNSSPNSLNTRFHNVFSSSNINFYSTQFTIYRHFSSGQRDNSDNSEEDSDEDDSDADEEEMNNDVENSGLVREYSLEEKESEAAAIGYKVIGQLEKSNRVFKRYEPVFAVIQIGSHQFKVSNGDCIYTERLKFCEVHDKIILNKVLMLGSKTQTMIGRPILPEAAVHAVVEEHALDAKVIIFKKKRRKNYRRKNGHRQELTKLRITDIQGIEKPEMPTPAKTKKPAAKKVEKEAVAA